MTQYPLVDIYKYQGREVKIFGLRPYQNRCGCGQCKDQRDTGFSADLRFLDNGETAYGVDSDYLEHQENDPRNWPAIVTSQGWDSVDEYNGILRVKLPKNVTKDDYVNRVLPKTVYLQKLAEESK